MNNLRLGDVCLKIGSGSTPRGGKDVYLQSGDIALIRSQNIYNDRFERPGLVYLKPEHAKQLDGVSVEKGDVLLNITGDSVARVCQVPDDVLPARVNQHVAIIRPNSELFDSRFLRFFLASPSMQQRMLGLAAAGATRNALTKGMIESFDIPNLSLTEQKAIGLVLGVLEDKIDRNRQTNETIEAIARALYKDWFIDFGPVRAKSEGRQPPRLPSDIARLFPKSMSDDGKPVGWTVSRLGDHVQNFDSKRVPVSGAEREKRRGIFPYHGATGVMDSIDSYLFDGIYLLIGEDGSVVKENGTAFTQYAWGQFWVNNHAHVLQGKGSVSTEQLLMYFQHEIVTPYITGAVQLKLSQGRMNSMPFIFPGDELCKKYSETVAPLFDCIRNNSDESKKLAQLRDLLIQKLVLGQITIKDTEKLVEEFS